MKKMTKLLCFAFAACLSLCSFSGCTPPMQSTKGVLAISSFEGGYGSTWATELGKAYAKYNPEIKVVVTCNPLVRDTAVTALQTGISDQDLFFIDGVGVGNYCERYGTIADISELYELTPKAGDKEESVLIKNKIMPEIVAEMKYGGDWDEFKDKYYTAPSPSGPCSLILNTDALDNVLGEGNWTEPRTTDELLSLCARIDAAKAKVTISGVKYTVYPFIYSGKAVEYWRYLYYPWIAQYSGIDAWNDMQTVRKNGEYDMTAYQPAGRLKAYEILERIIKRDGGYCDGSSMNNQFQQSQKYFLQGRACMYITGDWFETEVENSTDYKANVKMIKTPIISKFTEVIANDYSVTLTDGELSAIVTAVDAGETSLEGVSEDVFSRVATARSYVYTLGNSAVGFVPESSVNKDLAIDFLRFMYSEEGMKIVLRETQSYLPMTDAYDMQREGTVTQFRKSIDDMVQGGITYLMSSGRDPIHYRAGLDAYVGNEKPEVALGKKTGALTASAYFEKEAELLAKNWAEYMKVVG